MSHTERLSNDAILGLDIDLNIPTTSTTASIIQPNVNQPELNQTSTKKHVKRSDKLTSDILLSGRGIPKLLDTLSSFKFSKRNPKSATSHRKALSHTASQRYGDEHHYKNLSRVLQMYQNWGHSLSPHLKFDRFIENLSRGVDDSYTKNWVRNQIREEMRQRMEIETFHQGSNGVQTQQQLSSQTEVGNNASTITATVANNDITTQNSGKAGYTARSDNNAEHEEEWAELFGGRSSDTEGAATANAADASFDSTTQIRQTPMFSTYLRTSSQPVPSEDEAVDTGLNHDELDAFDALDAEEVALDELLNDDDTTANPDGVSTQQNVVFSQYIAHDEDADGQPLPQADEPQQTEDSGLSAGDAEKKADFSEDDFSDDDDALSSILL